MTPSPKVLPDYPLYSFGQLMCGLLNLHMTHFFVVFCPCPWGHEKGFDGVTPFEMHLNPLVVACPFEPFPNSVDVWYHYGDVFVV